MTGDIQKNITLIESIMLDESFKDAKTKFSKEAPLDIVGEYLDKFRELSTRNKIDQADKDISKWIGAGWAEFKKLVDLHSETKSKRELKNMEDKHRIIQQVNETTYIVIPLHYTAAQKYGKGTKWCVSALNENMFFEYFHVDGSTIIYVLTDNGKYAMTIGAKPEYRDILDKEMTFDAFKTAIGFDYRIIEQLYRKKRMIIENAKNLTTAELKSIAPSLADIVFPEEDIVDYFEQGFDVLPDDVVEELAKYTNGFVVILFYQIDSWPITPFITSLLDKYPDAKQLIHECYL